MSWLELQWKCCKPDCGYRQTEIIGMRPENQSARCRMCNTQHHLNITPKVSVRLWEPEDRPSGTT